MWSVIKTILLGSCDAAVFDPMMSSTKTNVLVTRGDKLIIELHFYLMTHLIRKPTKLQLGKWLLPLGYKNIVVF